MSKYPENEKLNKNDYNSIMEFINFLKDEGYEIRKWKNPKKPISPQDVVYEFFEVDKVKLEKERRQMLDSS